MSGYLGEKDRLRLVMTWPRWTMSLKPGHSMHQTRDAILQKRPHEKGSSDALDLIHLTHTPSFTPQVGPTSLPLRSKRLAHLQPQGVVQRPFKGSI